MPLAGSHVSLGLPVSRRNPLRKLMSRLLWPFFRHQVDFNHAAVADLTVLEQRLDVVEGRLGRIDGDLEHHSSVLVRHETPIAQVAHAIAVLGDHSQTIDELLAAADRHDQTFLLLQERIELVQRQAFARYQEGAGTIHREIAELGARLREIEHANANAYEQQRFASLHREEELLGGLAEIKTRLAEVDLFLAAAKRSLPKPPPIGELAELSTPVRALREAVVDAFAAPLPETRARLGLYVEDMRDAAKLGSVVDLAAGDGEWLRLLGAAGLAAYGIESSEPRAERARSLGADVRVEDALGHLRSLAPDSVGAISAFGLLEQLDLADTLEVLDLAHRAIRPGGALLVECLNPDNLVVATSRFYADPSRRRPLPSELLAFAVSARGFINVSTHASAARPGSRLSTPEPEAAPWAADLQPVIDLLNERLLSGEYYSLLARRP